MNENIPALAMDETELLGVLATSLYLSADVSSIKMVLQYCKAAGLDPMQKPVHIVPMWNAKLGRMVDVIMPGVGLYRTQAMRSGNYAGVADPEFGPDVTEQIGGVEITYPKSCKVTIKRLLPNGQIAEFSAVEFWKENYAIQGGKDKSIAPNSMWRKRPYGQIAKCAEAQALRKAFPECGSQPTAEEMEGKSIEAERDITPQPAASESTAPAHQADEKLIANLKAAAEMGDKDRLGSLWQGATPQDRKALGKEFIDNLKLICQQTVIDATPIEGEYNEVAENG